MRDIRCMVVRECVADRTRAVLDANLFDMDQKCADVDTLKDALDYLHAFPLKNLSSERMRPACSIAFPPIWRRFR
jgi:hypothetical protein